MQPPTHQAWTAKAVNQRPPQVVLREDYSELSGNRMDMMEKAALEVMLEVKLAAIVMVSEG